MLDARVDESYLLEVLWVMADYVVEQVRAAVADVPGVVSVRVDLVWEPVWDKSRMSEEALVELGLDED